jgi:hypothetical protein
MFSSTDFPSGYGYPHGGKQSAAVGRTIASIAVERKEPDLGWNQRFTSQPKTAA